MIGLDVLDAANIGPTLQYISEFKREISRLQTVMPKIWGLHNYSDVNRLESWRTAEIDRALGGQVWLTETGGIVQFGGKFPNRQRLRADPCGERREIRLLPRPRAPADHAPVPLRLDGRGVEHAIRCRSDERHEVPRAGYVVVCRELHAAKCAVKTARN